MTPYSGKRGVYTESDATDTSTPLYVTDSDSTAGPNTNKGPMMVKLNRAQRRKLMRLSKRRSK